MPGRKSQEVLLFNVIGKTLSDKDPYPEINHPHKILELSTERNLKYLESSRLKYRAL